jgi:hypothetical protein
VVPASASDRDWQRSASTAGTHVTTRPTQRRPCPYQRSLDATRLGDTTPRITLDDACNLADVYDLCARIARACLNDDDHVTFRRTVPDHTETQDAR